ncbi:ABC transporter permease [Desulfotalea psychrophila]|uniref:Probable sugar ABC transporter, permease protein n=1 Tax=Desulfotalea psychrophila (strain LSv54 / DSM 12343) TaxID=177439 RepID=Q6AQG5_DESPS|nr:ABC transporter permease [Desulfotalea psychrophila]CAG35408.1 probable sugar ABC transporter, permease protein [Desulfotalea psychrophila LSv54]
MGIEIIIPLLAATVQAGTPVLLATLGEIFTEKSGVLNLGVEGVMLVGALAGFVVSRYTGDPTLGFLAAGCAGLLLTSLHGIVCLWFQGNQVVSGLALTILGTGLANYLGTSFVGLSAPGFSPVNVPFLSAIPAIGPIFFQHDPLVYVSYLIPFVLCFLFNSTRFGLSLRSVGEYPAAATAAGINVNAYRWVGIWGGGFLMGLGGAYLSLAYTHMWTTNLTGGRGWIAVALVIFAFWRPGRAVFGAYLFGGIMSLQLRLQASGIAVPSSLLLMLPYFLTIFVLVLSSWRKSSSDEPAALGVNVEPID